MHSRHIVLHLEEESVRLKYNLTNTYKFLYEKKQSFLSFTGTCKSLEVTGAARRIFLKNSSCKWTINQCTYTVTSFAQAVLSREGGGTPLYQVYRYVPPQRVWFLSRFGLKKGIDFEHFGLKLGLVIGGTFTKAYNLIFLPSDWGE